MSCEQVIKAADKALDAKDQTIKLSDLSIKKLEENNTQLKIEVDKDNEKLASVWRNPFLWGAVGLVVGGLVLHK